MSAMGGFEGVGTNDVELTFKKGLSKADFDAFNFKSPFMHSGD